jgi:parallel beta-helix repeat protein
VSSSSVSHQPLARRAFIGGGLAAGAGAWLTGNALPADAATTTTPFVVSVRDLGAVGDGVADDTDCFTAAITMATGNAGAVFVGSGTYRVGPLAISRTCTMFGCGMDSIIRLVPGSATDLLTVTAPNVTVRQLLLDANGTSRSTVVVGPGAGGVTLQSCDLLGSRGPALRVGAPDAVVDRVLVRGAGGVGISVEGVDRVSIQHSEISGTGGDGIAVAGGSGSLVQGNIVDGTGGAIRAVGIRIFSGAVDARVAANAVRSTTSHGILVEGLGGSRAGRVAVRGNTVVGSGGHGLYVEGASGVTATANTVSGAGRSGIAADQGATGLVAATNVVQGCHGSGLRLDATSHFSLIGNILWGNGTAPPTADDAHGVLLGATAPVSNGVVAGNRCGDGGDATQLSGIALRGVVAGVSLRANSLDGNSSSGTSTAGGAATDGTGSLPTAAVTGVTVGAVSTAIPHGLHQPPDSVVISMRSAGQVWVASPSDATNIHLIADAPGRSCDVLVG